MKKVAQAAKAAPAKKSPAAAPRFLLPSPEEALRAAFEECDEIGEELSTAKCERLAFYDAKSEIKALQAALASLNAAPPPGLVGTASELVKLGRSVATEFENAAAYSDAASQVERGCERARQATARYASARTVFLLWAAKLPPEVRDVALAELAWRDKRATWVHEEATGCAPAWASNQDDVEEAAA